MGISGSGCQKILPAVMSLCADPPQPRSGYYSLSVPVPHRILRALLNIPIYYPRLPGFKIGA